jgi:hypothetical protein
VRHGLVRERYLIGDIQIERERCSRFDWKEILFLCVLIRSILLLRPLVLFLLCCLLLLINGQSRTDRKSSDERG